MTLADLLTELRAEAEMVDLIGPPFSAASVEKARERVRVLEHVQRIVTAAQAFAEGRVDRVSDPACCAECALITAVRS